MAHHFIHPTKYLELIVDGNVGLYMIGPASQIIKWVRQSLHRFQMEKLQQTTIKNISYENYHLDYGKIQTKNVHNH